MISFIWSDPLPMYSGRGGTESYTVGQIRELKQRGIPARILTYGLGKHDGREFFKDIEFVNLHSLQELKELDDTIIYINFPHNIPTKRKSHVIFHYPVLEQLGSLKNYKKDIGSSSVITVSRFLRSYWADYLNIKERGMHVVYPFADPEFSNVKRPHNTRKKKKILYAGRLSPEKGIYLLMESLHHPIGITPPMGEQNFDFTVVNAGNQTVHGQVIEQMLKQHPWVNVIDAKHNPKDMARLFASYDVVVVPSNHNYWDEAFGMVSVEAQHAGCRVVASNSGGLPETNCGELLLFEPGNSFALSKAILKASQMGPLTAEEREEAVKHFTRSESVDLLLKAINI